MPSEVTVMTDPLIVYGMIGLLVAAVLLALFFSRPRRGLGAATKADSARTNGLWMPGGDVFGREPKVPTAPADPETTLADPWALPPTDPAHTPPETDLHSPWDRR